MKRTMEDFPIWLSTKRERRTPLLEEMEVETEKTHVTINLIDAVIGCSVIFSNDRFRGERSP
jgi:hypothetical protein